MKSKINLLTGLMIISLFIIGTNASSGSDIKVSGPGKISGNIRCATSDLPVGNATVTLFSASDSSMVAGTISNDFGDFYFSMLAQGDYFLEISENGFEKKLIGGLSIKAGEPKICLNEIMLKPVSTSGKKHSKLFKIKF